MSTDIPFEDRPDAGVPLAPDVDRTVGGGPAPIRSGYLAAIFAGGMIGTLGRWAVAEAFGGAWAGVWGTLLVNLSGAGALGLLLARLAGGPDHGWRRLLCFGVGTGVLGAWTSYSALAVGTLQLALGGPGALLASGYLVATIVGGVLAAYAGIRLGTRA